MDGGGAMDICTQARVFEVKDERQLACVDIVHGGSQKYTRAEEVGSEVRK